MAVVRYVRFIYLTTHAALSMKATKPVELPVTGNGDMLVTAKDSSLKTLLKRLHNTHDPDSRAVVREIESLMREAEAWKFKYDNAMARIECLECQLAEAQHECPVYAREKAKGKI